MKHLKEAIPTHQERPTGVPLSGAHFSHAEQPDQRPSDSCSHDEAASTRPHPRQPPQHLRHHPWGTHLSCRVLEGVW